jgi:cell division protein FtsL
MDNFFSIILIIIIILIAIVIYIMNLAKRLLNKSSMVKNTNVYKRAANLGISYLEKLKSRPYRAGVMFDIDDTLLYVNEDTSLTPIVPIIDLLNYCITQDLLIIIITARDSTYRRQTIQQLNKYGINYSYLYLRKSPEDDHDRFKSLVKQRLYEEYNIPIIMSVGDNVIDVVGSYSGYSIKLPNKTDRRLFECRDFKNLVEVR